MRALATCSTTTHANKNMFSHAFPPPRRVQLFQRSKQSVVFITNLASRRDAFTMNTLEIPQVRRRWAAAAAVAFMRRSACGQRPRRRVARLAAAALVFSVWLV
jgi:hypothetical protein